MHFSHQSLEKKGGQATRLDQKRNFRKKESLQSSPCLVLGGNMSHWMAYKQKKKLYFGLPAYQKRGLNYEKGKTKKLIEKNYK